MVFGMFLMFLIMSAGMGVIVFVACKRIGAGIRENPERGKALADLIVMLGGRQDEPPKPGSGDDVIG
jgi:hypothetical protein